EIRARVSDHLDLADVELRARSIVRAGLFPAEEIADERCRQTLVGYHAIFDDVTDIYQHGFLLCVSEGTDTANDPLVHPKPNCFPKTNGPRLILIHQRRDALGSLPGQPPLDLGHQRTGYSLSP